MPSVRGVPKAKARAALPYGSPVNKRKNSKSQTANTGDSTEGLPDDVMKVSMEEDEKALNGVSFPVDAFKRSRFTLSNGKALTVHQWKVYDLLMRIPAGKVATYATMSKHLGSSPQAVGGALKNNPFAPGVPCHRVIASTLFVGGFQGEWEKEMDKTALTEKRGRKLRLLEREGVRFNDDGYLLDSEKTLWVPS